MTVAFDATFLLYLFAPNGQVGTPLDDSGRPVSFAKERVEGLVEELDKASSKILVATPALSEIMVRAGVEGGQELVRIMRKSRAFRIISFDERCAAQTAIMAGDIRRCPSITPATVGTYAKVKYDRQIVAAAVVEGATTLFTDDENMTRFARRHGLHVRGIEDCIVPTDAAQPNLELAGGHGDGLTS